MPQQHNPGRHVQSLTLPQSRHNHRNTSAYIFPTVPTPRNTPPTPEPATRRALPRLSAGPQRSNSPSQRSRPIQGTHLPPHAGPHRPDASDHPADTRPRLAAGTQRSNSPSQRSRSIQDTPLPPHNGPTPSQPSDHPAGAGFNRTAGHKKIRLCEPDLFICQ